MLFVCVCRVTTLGFNLLFSLGFCLGSVGNANLAPPLRLGCLGSGSVAEGWGSG